MNSILLKNQILEITPGRVTSGYMLTIVFKDESVMTYIFTDKEDFKRAYKRYGGI